MKSYGLNELREMFLRFFETKEHLRLPSFSLIPQDDASLLLINSGMAPMKPYFKGDKEPPRHRICTCQKCIRTGDIENIGKTARHGTYFEMLGNFSFGDYFKHEAIAWSWEFLTSPEWVGLDPERLYPSVYEKDDEAFNIWRDEIGIPEQRITRLGKEDNFWEHGSGPCGPCSEIYFDRGEEYGCGKPDCAPGCDCDRYMEVWNNVFSQFDNDVVEDDTSVRNLITTTLKTHEYRYLTAPDGQSAILETSSHNPDIVLLDLGLPDIDGVEIIKKIRTWSNMPIIVISARSEDTDKIDALDAGADDYLTKPFSVEELLARLRVTQRRLSMMQKVSPAEAVVFVNGKLRVDYAAGCAYLNEEELHLTPIEYKLLCLLTRNIGKVLTHTFLTQSIWGSSWDNDIASLRVFMATLRKKIEKEPNSPQYIQTHIGVGYRMLKVD